MSPGKRIIKQEREYQPILEKRKDFRLATYRYRRGKVPPPRCPQDPPL